VPGGRKVPSGPVVVAWWGLMNARMPPPAADVHARRALAGSRQPAGGLHHSAAAAVRQLKCCFSRSSCSFQRYWLRPYLVAKNFEKRLL